MMPTTLFAGTHITMTTVYHITVSQIQLSLLKVTAFQHQNSKKTTKLVVILRIGTQVLKTMSLYMAISPKFTTSLSLHKLLQTLVLKMLHSSSLTSLLKTHRMCKYTQSTALQELLIQQWIQFMMSRRRLLACLCKHKKVSPDLCTHSFRKKQVR
uniref:ORF3b n=1 Tax=SARS coronavirus Urbani TaxID=228330 RepID=A0A3G5BJ20_SARS|nr:ORF3b [SARS coronavirus Urbani]AYV99791.1 ORF3b [SARS coronavirus Urbani]